jgi:hypothetical protein
MSSSTSTTIAARLLAGLAIFALSALGGADALRAEDTAEQAGEPLQILPSADEELPEDIDWGALAAPLDRPYAPPPKRRTAPPPQTAAPAWSRNDQSNGTAAVSVTQPVSPFWDMKAGVNLDVVRQTSPVRTPVTLPDKLAADSRAEHSQAAAWITAKAPGVPYLSDDVALEVRMDPSRAARLGTAFSKSLPLWGEHFSLTLRHGYYVTQHDAIPGLPGGSSHGRSFDMERSARFSIADTGTTFLAGQSLSPASDRWLSSIGAEQKLFGGLSITGSVNETPEGFSNKSLTAGFRKSW